MREKTGALPLARLHPVICQHSTIPVSEAFGKVGGFDGCDTVSPWRRHSMAVSGRDI
jgi:hypothetical protein